MAARARMLGAMIDTSETRLHPNMPSNSGVLRNHSGDKRWVLWEGECYPLARTKGGYWTFAHHVGANGEIKALMDRQHP